MTQPEEQEQGYKKAKEARAESNVFFLSFGFFEKLCADLLLKIFQFSLPPPTVYTALLLAETHLNNRAMPELLIQAVPILQAR